MTMTDDSITFEQIREQEELAELARLEDVVFSASANLRHIRAAARSRMLSPWGMLGCVLANLSAEIEPRVTLPPIVGAKASLNLAVGLVGPSGTGKSATNSAARDVFGPSNVRRIGPGSGEGIIQSFLVWNDRTKEYLLHSNPRCLLYADEIGQVGAIQGRNGSSFAPVIRSMWSGNDANTTNAESRRNRSLEAHTYRLAIVAGIQPELADILLDDSDGGTPQRFLWMPVTDPFLPDDDADLPDDPGSLDIVENWAILGGRPQQITVVPEVTRFVREQHRKRMRGEGDALDGHAILVRLKVAALLAALEDKEELDEVFWALSEPIMQVSDMTRGRCVSTLRQKHAKEASERGAREARQQREHAINDEEEIEKIAMRVVEIVESFMERMPDSEGCPMKFISQGLGTRTRPFRHRAIEHAIELEWLEEVEGATTRWKPGKSSPRWTR